MAKGDPDAPVVMVEFADFQCPFCGRFARETAPALVEQYVDEGILRIEWRDFPYLGPESRMAALAGRAAARQDAFWAFHDVLYAEAREVNSGTIDAAWLEGVAADLGLDVEQFRADMGSAEVASEVAADLQAGQSLGVTGTPAFFVNGQPVLGAQPLEVFEQVIEAAQAQASS